MTHKDDKPLPELDVDDPSSPFYIPSYKIEKTKAGFSLETDGSDRDHKHALEALRTLLGSSVTAAEPIAALVSPAVPAPAAVSPSIGIGVGEAARKYLLTLDSRTVADWPNVTAKYPSQESSTQPTLGRPQSNLHG